MNTNIVTQIGIIVKDIEKTARKYAEVFNMKMPDIIITDPVAAAHTQYRGKPTEARAKLAFFKMGQVDIELIEPDLHPSTWREFLDTHGEGVHHIAFDIKGMETTVSGLADKNMRLVQKGDYTGGRYAYIDSTADLKVILELLENF
jgi:4-hydroxyphenylpyruvate dioxygenase-like putative hemolysin